VSRAVLDALIARFGGGGHSYRGDDTYVTEKPRILEILTFLKTDPAMLFDFPTDLTVVDRLGHEPRFDVVYQLRSIQHKHRIRVKVPVTEEEPTIASATPLWRGFNWPEREAFDMYGIKFEGHPDLRRMFMYDSFVGHPLRKDYPKEKRQPLIRREGLP
jgi:NADH-quinone oxidoreductase subunit C